MTDTTIPDPAVGIYLLTLEPSGTMSRPKKKRAALVWNAGSGSRTFSAHVHNYTNALVSASIYGGEATPA
jgi:hypothetical protein